jgi:hypothetical protein
MKQQQVDALKELFKDANEVDKEIQKCKDHLDLLHGRSRLRLQLAVNSLGTAKGHLLEILQGLELLIDEAEEGEAGEQTETIGNEISFRTTMNKQDGFRHIVTEKTTLKGVCVNETIVDDYFVPFSFNHDKLKEEGELTQHQIDNTVKLIEHLKKRRCSDNHCLFKEQGEEQTHPNTNQGCNCLHYTDVTMRILLTRMIFDKEERK